MEFCDVCGKDASHTCGACRQVAYCSADCQIADWPEHVQWDCTDEHEDLVEHMGSEVLEPEYFIGPNAFSNWKQKRNTTEAKTKRRAAREKRRQWRKKWSGKLKGMLPKKKKSNSGTTTTDKKKGLSTKQKLGFGGAGAAGFVVARSNPLGQ